MNHFRHSITWIKEKSKLCEVNDVTVSLCANSDSDSSNLGKKLLLEKDLTFAKAQEICLNEEKAIKTAPASYICRWIKSQNTQNIIFQPNV